MLLFLSLSCIALVGITIYTLIYRSKKRDKATLKKHWNLFLEAKKINNIPAIQLYGDKLIWNHHLQKGQLAQIIECIDDRIQKFPHLNKLRNDAFNKQLHHNRILPMSGSSGSIKQSW